MPSSKKKDKKQQQQPQQEPTGGGGGDIAMVTPRGVSPPPHAVRTSPPPQPTKTPAAKLVIGKQDSDMIPTLPLVSAEVDEDGKEHLAEQKWQKMSQDAGVAARSGTGGGSTFDAIFTKLYGNLPKEERFRVLWLACTLFFIIGGYWLLRSLKDPIVATIVGVEYIPKCKMLSLVVVFFLVFIYNKLIDMMPKHQLFYVVGGFYVGVFGVVSVFLADPEKGILNTNASPDRYLGWISYCAIESFGSICVSLFWAFVNSTMTFEGAKSAYGLIIAGAQIGSILGPTIAASLATKIGVAKLYSMGSVSMALMVVMMYGYVHIFGVPPSIDDNKKKSGDVGGGGGEKDKGKSAGVLEGFQLFMRYNYVKGIFAISCLFMVEGTILDYMMKVLANKTFTDLYPDDHVAATKHFAAFMGNFGQVANSISFIFSLLGTSMVIRRLGLRKTIVLFPILCLGIVCMVVTFPKLEIMFFAMILLKGFSYSLNNPCKEMLYQPTSMAIKFKSKSWIDIFGARGSKAVGSVVTNAFTDSVEGLITYGGLVAMGVSSSLIYIAFYMGKMFEELIENEQVIGQDDDKTAEQHDQLSLTELATADTSCGLDDEGQEYDDDDDDDDVGVSDNANGSSSSSSGGGGGMNGETSSGGESTSDRAAVRVTV